MHRLALTICECAESKFDTQKFLVCNTMVMEKNDEIKFDIKIEFY